jgi:hypothetical protein
MYINNISVNSRHNRPSVLTKTALVTYFYNDGLIVDPYQISAVSVFLASSNQYPSSVIADYNELANSTSGFVLLNFANSASLTSDSSFDASNYSIGSTGIYKLRTGVYAVVIDPSIVSSTFNLSGTNAIDNNVTATGDYIDIWSVVRAAGSDLDTIVNEFTLSEDRFYHTTEPLLFRVATRLENNHIVLGSKVNLKFTNEFTIENASIDRSVVNLFKDSLVLNPAIEIYKENSDRNLASRVSVSSFSQTSSLCDVTSDNTVVFNFDTSLLASHPSMLNGTLGSQTGTYIARLKFNALDQVIYSNNLAFIVR